MSTTVLHLYNFASFYGEKVAELPGKGILGAYLDESPFTNGELGIFDCTFCVLKCGSVGI